jgi:hypothetical protein
VPIRLALIELPQLLADIIADTFAADDWVHVDRLQHDAALDLAAGGRHSHDVVITGVEDPWSNRLRERMTSATDPLLLGVRVDGRDAWVYQMQPCPHRLGPVNPEQIRALVLTTQDRTP